MATETAKPPARNTDRRRRVVDEAMRRHGHRADGLIETLHKVQETYGFLDEEALAYVARALRLPPSKVFGVATFYHLFTLKPQGEHTCVACMGTACYIKGTGAILDKIESDFGVRPGETTPDNKLSLLTARCVGSCGLAPAMVFDGQVAGKMTPAQVVDELRKMTGRDT